VTVQTRRRVLVAVVALALTLPTESILLKALTTPSLTAAAQQYVGALTPGQLFFAAGSVQAFPIAYRRAIMKALSPTMRSLVWRGHIANFLAANPNLDDSTVAALQSAMALASPTAFSAPPSDDDTAQIKAIADQVTATLGRDTALTLLYRLGPADGTFASIEPLSDKLANMIRDKFVTRADSSPCDCNQGWGCDGNLLTMCAGGTSCSVQTDWPACGWLWRSPCDGSCQIGMGGPLGGS